MKEKMKRIIAGLLLAGLVVSGVPAAAVYAEEGSTEPPVQTQETDEAQNEKPEELAVNNIFNKEAADDETSAQEEAVQEEPAQEETAQEDAVQEELAEDAAQEEADREDGVQNESVQEKSSEEPVQEDAEQKDEVSAGTIDFVYIEKPYLTTPDTQRIVVAFDEGISGTDEIALTVEDESGSQTEWPLAKEKDGLYLFEKEFTGEAYTGTYQAVSLQLGAGDDAETVDLADMDVQAEFGVNEEYDGYDELQPMDEEAAAEDAVEASVVTIDENGVTEAQDDIADALNTAGIQTAGISTFSRAASRSVEPRTGNIVIALDPGHDSRSPGASANGLKEEVLTLKIAKYCKAELEKYDGVEIYMTRTDADCPFDMSGAGCIEKRVNAAADAGAQIYVSFHLNSSTSSTPKGAEVIIQNKNWRPDVAEESEALAEKIMDELVALGLSEREIYYRNSEAGEKYADGSSADYYSVHRNCKLRNIPGIIIEHAFLTNSSDVNSFLKTEAGLKKLGVADAKGIVKYLGLDQGQWKTDEDGNRYFYVKGKKVTGEKKIGNAWYYFDPSKNGAMHTGWLKLDGRTLYYDASGIMVKGEKKISGEWYLFKESNGAMITGWYDFPNKRVYYDTDGTMVKGEKKISGQWYLFETVTGEMVTGWHSFSNKKVYYGTDGVMVKGEKKISGNWYMFEPVTGKMVTGWYDLPEKRVYYGTDGVMVKGEKKISGKWYLFNKTTGAMTTGWYDFPNKRVYYGTDGVMVKGSAQISGKWYLFKDSTGEMLTGWRKVDGNECYFTSDGSRASGELKINGKWYNFDSNTGEKITGWYDFPNKRVYYDGDGVMQKGEKKISGNWYLFNKTTGAMTTGWYNFPDKKVYYNTSGIMVKGEAKISGNWYLFNKTTGAMVTGWYDFQDKRVYYNQSGIMVKGQYTIGGKTYFFEKVTGALVKNGFGERKYYGADGVLIPEEEYETIFYKIEGKSSVTIEQMVAFYEDHATSDYPSEELKKGGAETIQKLAEIFFEEAASENIKAEVAWAQTMLETGYLAFGGQIKADKFNFAGLGATDDGAAGASFKDVRTGVRAQIQHLKAYASNKALEQECVDPRFNLVKRNTAKYVEILGQKENPEGYGWATSQNYGLSIAKLISVLKK